jgi:hypothetical protein
MDTQPVKFFQESSSSREQSRSIGILVIEQNILALQNHSINVSWLVPIQELVHLNLYLLKFT